MFKLDSNIGLNPYIIPICLPQTDQLSDRIVASGFGTTGFAERESNELLKVTLDLFTSNSCDRIFANHGRVKQGIDYRAMFCAGSKDPDKDKDTCNVRF